MRKLLFIILLFAFILSNGQSDIERIVGKDLDTIVDYDDKTFIVGSFKEKNDVAGNSYGLWKEYYRSGKLKGTGTLAKGSYTQCCTAGPCELSYMYKIGHWTYYYENGKLKAEGNYNTQVYNFPTSCQGGDNIVIQKVGDNWKYYDETGNMIPVSKEMITELETIHTGYGKHIPVNWKKQ